MANICGSAKSDPAPQRLLTDRWSVTQTTGLLSPGGMVGTGRSHNSTAIIIGAGVAGLAAGHALHQAGYRISIYEQAHALKARGAALSRVCAIRLVMCGFGSRGKKTSIHARWNVAPRAHFATDSSSISTGMTA